MVYEVTLYQTTKGDIPVRKWLSKLNVTTRDRVYSRLMRIEQGNFGDHKQIETELYELRFFFDGGLRVYYTVQDERVVVLFCGGNKKSQKRDISKAIALLYEYKKELNDAST
ncbi:MAG: type II toxin-antitoxin system RelE/ParE family toxin [Sedimentisphaeraceae bacterium JB056]